MAEPTPVWWKEGTCYQIWPTSYKDSNGDGIGDIPGIISTLDYLQGLGVDIIWLSPMYQSPQVDMGYDISDYEDVYPAFGTLADMDELIKQTRERKMRLILDLVINHTSDQHAWFQESKSSRTNPKANWYVWRPPRYTTAGAPQPPNNWASFFGGSAWEYCPERDEYYLHMFSKEQPDLNWREEECRRAIYDSAIRFWLERGVAGFRVDTAGLYSKDPAFPDAAILAPGAEYQPPVAHVLNGPNIHDWLKEMRREVLDHYGHDIFLVAELGPSSPEEKMRYVSAASREYDTMFEFEFVLLGVNSDSNIASARRPTLSEIKDALARPQHWFFGTDAWPTVFAENHDSGRSISRFGNDGDAWRVRSGKVLATLFATLSGSLYLYQGQEIGMANIPDSWGAEELKDIMALGPLAEVRREHPDDEDLYQRTLRGLRIIGRDNARTPMQWTRGPNAGFTAPTATPWMRIHDNYPHVNVADQLADPDSLLAYWKRMLQLRKQHKDLFIHGRFSQSHHHPDDPHVFTYTKHAPASGQTALVELNFSESPRPRTTVEEAEMIPVEDREEHERRAGQPTLLVSNVPETEIKPDTLAPWEARVSLYPGRG